MRNKIPKPIKRMVKRMLFPIPSHLSINHIHISDAGMTRIKESIKQNYHTGWRKESNYTKEMYEIDLNAHLFQRLEEDRRMIIPWIDDTKDLDDKRILEIGCGTGSSTVALAEQGAEITGIDIDDGALEVAKDRSRVYGLYMEFLLLNADQILNTFGTNSFDFIIYFACLEHMTIPERLASLRQAWEMLSEQGLLIIVETPNRLWYFDGHTSRLPFYHWLPVELAFHYSKFSSRENFRKLYNEYNDDTKNHFLRRGRGMSYHELELAIRPLENIKVVSSISTYQGIRYKLKMSNLERRYKSLLMKIHPNIHEGFFDKTLYLILEK